MIFVANWKLVLLVEASTDNGIEYVSNKFQDYLRTEGVKHERSIPNNSEQNRVAERMNRTLVDIIWSMLLDSKLPKIFWTEALLTAVYFCNRSHTKTLAGITPHLAWI